MTLPKLSEAQIRQHASAESYARGASYYHGGAVSKLVRRGNLLQAEVEGSQHEPYQVTVSFDQGGVHYADCTCPYDWGGWCKHIVATLLAYAAADPGDVEVRPPLAELLAGLDRDQLASLLLRLAEQEASLADRIDMLLATPMPGKPVASSAPARRTTVDTTAFRRQVRHAFSGSRYDDYYAASSIVEALQSLLEQIRSFIVGDDAENALLLLEALTEEYSERWVDYDDSDGELGGFFDDLGALWAEALLTADLGQSELAQWQKRLGEWAATAEEYGCEGLITALQAAEEGWSMPWLTAALSGETPDGALSATEHDPALLSIRLEVLERKGLIREALHLAAASSMRRQQGLLLLRLGQGAAAVELGRQSFRTPDEALALAEALRDRGDVAGALAIGEHGLSLGATVSPHDPSSYGHALARARLGAWLVDPAASQGRIDLALRAGTEALRGQPELRLYKRLAELAGPEWPALRERLLELLRTSTSWMSGGLVDIFLHEGLIDDAIATVSRSTGGTDLVRVMDAAVTTRPDWVIATAKARAEGIANAGDAKHYDAAVEWLRRARAAYQAVGRSDEWAAYFKDLRAKHARKYKLAALLDLLERSRR